MKVLHIVGGDLTKGAFRGAFWLHQGLVGIGVDSRILGFIPPHQLGERVAAISQSKPGKLVDKFVQNIDRVWLAAYPVHSGYSFNTGFIGRDITRHEAYADADLVNLHWMSNGVTSLRQIPKLGKPTVVTIRDMWAFTGGCHYALDCEGYVSTCGRCPQLASRMSCDLSRVGLAAKKKYLAGVDRVVGISTWIAECARRSAVFSSTSVVAIPNCVDTVAFFRVDRGIARDILGLARDERIVLVGASNVEGFYKGWSQFVDAVPKVTAGPVRVLTFGKPPADNAALGSTPVTHLGYLHDDVSLRLAYSAADVFVAPSIQEAFGKTLAEAMACGTPVVCFDATGPADIVEHRATGYKAAPFESADLARGIDWVLSFDDPAGLSRNSIARACNEFSKEVVARKYAELYCEILAGSEQC